jgi:Na+/proline symporter
MAAALGIPTPIAIIGLGIVVTVMALMGGQWAVAATDFVQTLLMFLTVAVVIYFAVNLPEIGGIFNLHHSLPERHFQFSEFARMELVIFWLIVMQVITIINTLNLNTEGAKYLQVKDRRQARGMVLLRFFLLFVIPLSVLMQIPAMCAATVFPDMGALFPDLKIPEEGAFLAMAFHTLPQGMMGLLVCGMFAASMSSMDTALNRNAGYFVRNVYIKYLNREADNQRQLLMGKVFTGVFGAVIVAIGLTVDQLRTLNLFDLFQVLNAVVWLPSLVPAALGVIYKKTPGWSGWSTVLVGLTTAAIASSLYSPELLQNLLGDSEPLNNYENADGRFIFTSTIVLSATVGWFFLTTLFYKRSSESHKQQVEELFQDMATPIDHVAEGSVDQDAMQARMVGWISVVFGGMILLGMLIPNPPWGRACFLFVGGTLAFIGWLLLRSGRKAISAS